MSALPNLSIRQLMTFREVMRTSSITEASRSLGRTQPAVSSMISNLEGQLNLPLFVREQGRLIPTPEAHYFLEEANDVLERLERTARSMSEFSTKDRGHLRIACYPAGASFFLPNVLADFLQDRPEVRADFMMSPSQMVEDLIASQEFDIGLAETPVTERGSMHTQVFELQCSVALNEHDPLVKKESVHIRDLDGYPMAALSDEHVITIDTQEAFKKAGAEFNRRFAVRTFLPTIKLVSANLCAAIVDGLTASTTPAEGAVFIPLKPKLTSSIAILLPAHRPISMLAKAFDAELSDRLGELGTCITSKTMSL